ncbi:hypothetical protein [Pollutimonas harenae]|uniref:Uncharacterized protein n=1 Tax=Pollutimonas harenae TaxID=657015 RepID=A0A853GYB2_9BURK|nr:hypothetical protein [Pollutimonas harenae]NYT84369.1 hypothetical protein [Pollutimonas harenae]TEA73230.1 hypothetical protein ERD84_04785 [Pollutimonas harenae]
MLLTRWLSPGGLGQHGVLASAASLSSRAAGELASSGQWPESRRLNSSRLASRPDKEAAAHA